MRRMDLHKQNSTAAKTVTFDWLVLEALEMRSRDEKIPVSRLVNEIVKRAVMTNEGFYREMARWHNAQMYHYKSLAGDLK